MLPLAPLMTPERLTTPRPVLPSATADSLALCDLTTPAPVPRAALVVDAAASVAVVVAVEVVVAALAAEVVVAVVAAAVTSAPLTAPSLASLAPRSPSTKMV